MSTYNLKWNSDDSVIRHIIIGLLADLNNKVYFKRQISETERITVDVPFYYSITGDDEFLRDSFLFNLPVGVGCTPNPDFADGNYDVVPRGVANLSSMSIDAGRLVNKGIRGSYLKMNSDGMMTNQTSEFHVTPIDLLFDIEILVSSTLDALKLSESIVRTLYKSNYFNVEVGHLEDAIYRLPSYYQLPEDFSIDRPIDFSFEDKDKYKVTFSIEVSSFIPSFSSITEAPTLHTIQVTADGNPVSPDNPAIATKSIEIPATEIPAHKRMFNNDIPEGEVGFGRKELINTVIPKNTGDLSNE